MKPAIMEANPSWREAFLPDTLPHQPYLALSEPTHINWGYMFQITHGREQSRWEAITPSHPHEATLISPNLHNTLHAHSDALKRIWNITQPHLHDPQMRGFDCYEVIERRGGTINHPSEYLLVGLHPTEEIPSGISWYKINPLIKGLFGFGKVIQDRREIPVLKINQQEMRQVSNSDFLDDLLSGYPDEQKETVRNNLSLWLDYKLQGTGLELTDEAKAAWVNLIALIMKKVNTLLLESES